MNLIMHQKLIAQVLSKDLQLQAIDQSYPTLAHLSDKTSDGVQPKAHMKDHVGRQYRELQREVHKTLVVTGYPGVILHIVRLNPYCSAPQLEKTHS